MIIVILVGKSDILIPWWKFLMLRYQH